MATKRWVRDDVVKELSRGFRGLSFELGVDHGRYDCPNITFRLDGVDDAVIVTPYLSSRSRKLPSIRDCARIFAVELRTRSGRFPEFNSSRTAKFGVFYGVCHARLRHLGFEVIGRYSILRSHTIAHTLNGKRGELC